MCMDIFIRNIRIYLYTLYIYNLFIFSLSLYIYTFTNMYLTESLYCIPETNTR